MHLKQSRVPLSHIIVCIKLEASNLCRDGYVGLWYSALCLWHTGLWYKATLYNPYTHCLLCLPLPFLYTFPWESFCFTCLCHFCQCVTDNTALVSSKLKLEFFQLVYYILNIFFSTSILLQSGRSLLCKILSF